MRKNDLLDLVVEALQALGGCARIAAICKHIWDNHEQSLRSSGDLFYTWQYEMRWAGQTLRKQGILAAPQRDFKWRLTK